MTHQQCEPDLGYLYLDFAPVHLDDDEAPGASTRSRAAPQGGTRLAVPLALAPDGPAAGIRIGYGPRAPYRHRLRSAVVIRAYLVGGQGSAGGVQQVEAVEARQQPEQVGGLAD
ncbi:hypothetical protein [Microbispora sp. NPDC049125]|uniref:hypothetical protein n=1 Tax=Microbispora sp. NPDC049125 TaxID=3154929 RepID=UPI003465D32B